MENFIKKYFKYFVIVIGVIIVLLLCLTKLKNKETNYSENSTPTSSTSQPNNIEESETQYGNFEKISFNVNKTMANQSDYWSLTKANSVVPTREDYLLLSPALNDSGNQMTYYLGHKLYCSERAGGYVVYSGSYPFILAGKYDNNGNGYFRTETGERIHLFYNSYDKEHFEEEWNAGQRVLEGKTVTNENSIIFDGRLTPYTFTFEQGDYYFSLRDLLPYVSMAHNYSETDAYLKVFVNEYVTVSIPTSSSPSGALKALKASGNRFLFKSWNGEEFETYCSILNANTLKISAKEANIIFGWDFYTDGNVLSIVTDPLNVSSLSDIGLPMGDMGIITIFETEPDGSVWARTYDSFNNLISEVQLSGNYSNDYNNEKLNKKPDSLPSVDDIDNIENLDEEDLEMLENARQ